MCDGRYVTAVRETEGIHSGGSDTTQSHRIQADSQTTVLPRSVRSSVSREADNSSFFDHTYMADESEILDDDLHKQSNYHVAFLRWTVWLAISLIISDVLVMLASVALVMWAYSYTFSVIDRDGMLHMPSMPLLSLVFVCVWIFSLWVVGCYHRHLMGEGYDLYAKIVNAAFVAVLVAGVFAFIARAQLSRQQIIWVFVLAMMLTCLERWIWRRIIHVLRLHGKCRYPVTLVGTWQGIAKAEEDIRSNAGLGYRAIAAAPIIRRKDGTVQSDPLSVTGTGHNVWAQQNDLRILPFNSHLAATAHKLGSQVILLVDGIDRGSRDYTAFSLTVQASGMELSIPVSSTGDINNGFVFYLHNTMDTMPVLTSVLPQFRWFRRLVKRAFDLVISTIAIVLCAIPMLVTAIAIKHEDGGPIFYLQDRIGQYGKPFKIIKFRSMKVGANKMDAQLARQLGIKHGVTFKVKDDPRITKVGHFIRKTSIDELPQLFNVFIGQMSIVGPRPQQAYERDQYNPVYATRLLVKPGITGPWQISGRSNLSPKQGEQLDVWYVANNSFTGDLAILLKTIPAVLSGNGAY